MGGGTTTGWADGSVQVTGWAEILRRRAQDDRAKQAQDDTGERARYCVKRQVSGYEFGATDEMLSLRAENDKGVGCADLTTSG